MGLTTDDIVKLFEKNIGARKRFAELLTVEPDVRLMIINAVIRDVATRQDLAELKRALEAKIEREVDRIEKEMDRLYKLVIVSVLGILILVITTIGT